MVAQVGKTSLILSLVSEEFPEEVSCPNLSLTYLLTLRLTIVNQFLFTFRSMFNLYISFEINVLRIIYLAVTVLCNLLWHSLTTPLPAHHLVRDNYTPMVLLQCPFQNKKIHFIAQRIVQFQDQEDFHCSMHYRQGKAAFASLLFYLGENAFNSKIYLLLWNVKEIFRLIAPNTSLS